MSVEPSYTVSFRTLGCRVNQYEPDAIAEGMEKLGFRVVKPDECADVVIVNTCTVTGEADRKVRQTVRRAAIENPGAVLIVAGCFVQIHPDVSSALPGVSAIVGNEHKSTIPEIALQLLNKREPLVVSGLSLANAEYDPMTVFEPRRTRSYVKIEDGCENRCAYCIIPKARGPVRSRNPEQILAEICSLASSGCSEFILTGIETGSYGDDTSGAFSIKTLVPRIAEIPNVRRIGFGSLDPTSLRDDLLEVLSAVPSVMPHFHISMQSGSSTVLARMRRRYNVHQAMKRIAAIRSFFPDVFLTCDLIVGFPGETETEFEETLAFCREIRFLHAHIFPFSIREGTEAATMPNQVPENEKRHRVDVLEKTVQEKKRELLEEYVCAHKEKPIMLLAEEVVGGMWRGHSEHYAEIKVIHGDLSVGQIVPVCLTETDGTSCFGRVAN